ncbi:MAG: SH3 domain-containing protein, partial [Anaerovoracaceae bacterium]
MKKALSIILALGLVFSFTACGNSNTTQKQTADDKIVVEDTVYDISGDVEKSEGGQLTIASNAKEELTFNIENAEIVPDDTIESGDRVNITYTGEIKGGDAKDCKVIKVEDTTEKVKTIKGKVLEHTEDGVIIKTSDGKELKFDIEGAELRYKDGIKKGDSIAVSYTGRINGTDTSGATVHEVTDNMKTKHKEAVKVTIKTVNETVYTCTIVNVRSTHSLAGTKIGTLDPKTKLTRTGICSNGWSRVNYNGKIAYVSSSYLTTKKPAVKKETKKETAKKETKAKEDPT